MRTRYVDRGAKPLILALLAELSAARRNGDQALVAELEVELDAADRRRGWTRSGGFTRDASAAPARRHSWRAR